MRKCFVLPKLPKDAVVESYRTAFNRIEINDVEIVSFDRSQDFLSKLKESAEDIILLIPTILDPFNACSYDGVDYALRCYFHFVETRQSNFGIVLLGIEEESAFWHHCEYAQILKCPHISYIKNNIYAIKEYLNKAGSTTFNIDWQDCIEQLKKINIKQPASYKTHHSITNEWSIYRWSKYLGIKNIEIEKEIEDFLYFNYLKAIYPETPIDSKQILSLGKGKILLIDDEVGKGWHNFFKSLCNKNSGVEFDSTGSTFKSLSQEEIIYSVEKKVKDFNPDVVVLDLRLHDDDFDIKDPLQLTGAKIFELIKTINKGIQIVIFSASNKVWNYLPFASDGVILKESPELSIKNNYTQECIKNLRNTLTNCIKRQYLREIYPKFEKVKILLKQYNFFGDKTDVILGNIDVAFDLLAKNNRTIGYNAYSFLQLYIVIEEFVNQDSVIDITENDLYLCNINNRYRLLKDKKKIGGGKMYEYNSVLSFKSHFVLKKDKYQTTRFIDTNFRISALLIFKFGKPTSSVSGWTDIYNNRNTKAAHPQKGEITVSDIHQILDFMLFFFNENNASWRDIKDAFPEESMEEQMKKLQEKFSSGNSKKN